MPSNTNEKISNFPLVVVNVGAVPPGHLTLYDVALISNNQGTVTDPPDIVKSRTKEFIFVLLVFVIEKDDTDAFRVNLNAVAAAKSIVTTPIFIVGVENVSKIPSEIV